MTGIEILICGKVLEEGRTCQEIEKEVSECITKLTGDCSCVKNTKHEIRLEHEGRYEFEETSESICEKCSKKDTSECKGHSKTFYGGVIVSCSGFHQRKE
ncbi:hypothetical protein KAU33_04085 [Candidatus Dependentiae bacterium]|nr:hypothetical protein [Candidatus Dependentiae bacterium]